MLSCIRRLPLLSKESPHHSSTSTLVSLVDCDGVGKRVRIPLHGNGRDMVFVRVDRGDNLHGRR